MYRIHFKNLGMDVAVTGCPGMMHGVPLCVGNGPCHHRVIRHGLITVNHKKGGSTFVVIILENLDGF